MELGEHQLWIWGGDTRSTTINIVSIELWNPRAGLLAEVLRLKIKCYRKEEYLLTYLTQPLSPNLLFALGKEVRSVFKSPKWQQVWPPGKATLLTTGDSRSPLPKRHFHPRLCQKFWNTDSLWRESQLLWRFNSCRRYSLIQGQLDSQCPSIYLRSTGNFFLKTASLLCGRGLTAICL